MSSKIANSGVVTAAVRWRSLPPSFAKTANRSGADPFTNPADDLSAALVEAQQRGYREGLQDGQARARKDLEPVVQRLAASVAEILQYKEALRRQAEQDMLRLSLGIARRVLHRELSTDPDSLHALIRAAIDRLKACEVHRVRIHPDHQPQLLVELNQAGLMASVEVIPDASLELGGIVFETNRGSLDASVSSQMEEVRRLLQDFAGDEQ
jgi:flagellar assembly protein FliH